MEKLCLENVNGYRGTNTTSSGARVSLSTERSVRALYVIALHRNDASEPSSAVISRSRDGADSPSSEKKRIRPRAFAHLGSPWLPPSHHLLLPRERLFLAARQYGDPFRHREIAFSASSAPALSILTRARVNFLLAAYINFRA